jgi:hypothetical protein
MKNRFFSSLFAALLLFAVVSGSMPANAAEQGIQSDVVFLMTDQKILLSYDLPGTILENLGAFHITYVAVLGAAPDPDDLGSGTFLKITATNFTQTYSDLNIFMVAGFFGNSIIGNWAYSDGPYTARVRASSSFTVGMIVTFVLFGTEDSYRIEMEYYTETQ